MKMTYLNFFFLTPGAPSLFFFFFFFPFTTIDMTKVFESRKPEPYIKTSCKKCITPIEYLPEGVAVGQKVSVKCFACEQVESYIVTEPNAKPTQSNAKSKASSSRRKGTGTRSYGHREDVLYSNSFNTIDEKPVSTEYYDLLGIQVSADQDEIKKAYRKMAIRYHPDKNQNDPTAEDKVKIVKEEINFHQNHVCLTHQQFKKISEAYQILSDPKLRKRYNEFGEENGVKPDGGFGK
jgi:DnaJ-domain-containing protein 1